MARVGCEPVIATVMITLSIAPASSAWRILG
jgi:hypothetical protein